MADAMKILLAIDGSAASDAAVRFLISHVRPEHVEVRVLHAVEWLRELPDSYRFGAGPTFAENILERKNAIFHESERLVARVAAELQAASFKTTTATPDADARHAIVDLAAHWPADLILMGSHGRTGLDRFLLGSVAESVVRHASCSVHVVRVRRATPDTKGSTTIL